MTLRSDFPPRSDTEEMIVKFLQEKGGSVAIRDAAGWTIYEELADRLALSDQARQRLTASKAELAWRPEVGYAKKNLVQRGVIQPSSASGRGVWKLAVPFTNR